MLWKKCVCHWSWRFRKIWKSHGGLLQWVLLLCRKVCVLPELWDLQQSVVADVCKHAALLRGFTAAWRMLRAGSLCLWWSPTHRAASMGQETCEDQQGSWSLPHTSPLKDLQAAHLPRKLRTAPQAMSDRAVPTPAVQHHLEAQANFLLDISSLHLHFILHT